MALNDFLGKIDKFIQEGSKKLEDALNGGVNSADSAVNSGIDELRKSADNMIEKTGIKEGILFLDEINCVSETLAPSMLQFLQYKIFGK